jgi:hypothetical protein
LIDRGIFDAKHLGDLHGHMKHIKFMKLFLKLLVWLIWLFPQPSSLFSQVYIPFPDSGIVWRQTSLRFDQATSTQICWDNQFELRGEDTIINSLSYSKLYYSGTIGPNGVCDLYSATNQNCWAIREDSSKHVFIFDYMSGQEYLIYDFNLTVNDTIAFVNGNAFSFHGTYDNYLEVITSIDSVLIDNVYHAAYNITSTNWMGVIVDYVQLIEGIGSTFGLFADNSPNWSEKYDFLNCVYINNQVVYFQTSPCSLLSSVANYQTREDIIKIYPNPVINYFRIKAKGSLPFRLNYSIINALGKKVKAGEINLFEHESQIEVGSFPEGIYYIKISTDTLERTYKIVKMAE